MQRLLIALTALVLASAEIASAQDAKPAAPTPIQDVRKLLNTVEEAFGRGDAKALAACWTKGGDLVGPAGERVEGRNNIENAFEKFFAARKVKSLKLQLASVRVAADNLVLLEMTSHVGPGTAEGSGEAALSLVLVKQGGRWLIEAARETTGPTTLPSQHLKKLEWMVGDWSDEVSPQNGVSVRSTCAWTANKAFLIRKFTVGGRADVARAGTEVIGWDPRTERIRSWVFDTDGSFGENVWVQEGNRWLVSYSGTSPDGSSVSATNVLTPVDANTVTVQSKNRTANGERQPDVPKLTLKRRSPAKATDSPKEPAKPQPVLP